MSLVQKIHKFFKEDLWRVDLKQKKPIQRFFIRVLKIIYIAFQGFATNQIQFGASTLVYYSLLALVPAVALMLGIAKGFHLESFLTNWLITHLGDQKEIVDAIIKFSRSLLDVAHSGIIATFGVLILFWSVIKILRVIELIFNNIWEVDQPRSVAKQFSDYLALILICPFIILTSSFLTVYFSSLISNWDRSVPFSEWIGPFLFFIVNFTSYLLTALLFTFVFIFIPNTRVTFSAALISGIFTAILYQVVQDLYVYFQIGVSKYNAIYGTFAAIPLFLVWLNLSWTIVLLGGKIAFATQNLDNYEFVSHEISISQRCKNILALRIAHVCIRQFKESKPPLTALGIAKALSIPQILVNRILEELIRGNILSEVKIPKSTYSAFQPARPIGQLTINRVIDMINDYGEMIVLPSTPELKMILSSLDEFNRLIENSDKNLLLMDI